MYVSLVLITARYAGECHECKDPIHAGDRAYYDGGTRKVYCLDCGSEIKDMLGEE